MTKDCGEQEARCANNNEGNGCSDKLVVPSIAFFCGVWGSWREVRREAKSSLVADERRVKIKATSLASVRVKVDNDNNRNIDSVVIMIIVIIISVDTIIIIITL